MEKDIEALAKLGEKELGFCVRKTLRNVEALLKSVESYDNDPGFQKNLFVELKGVNDFYHEKIKAYKELYGINFPEIQEEYNTKILPRLKKYLN